MMESANCDFSMLKSAIVDHNFDRVQELLIKQDYLIDQENNQDLLNAAIEVRNLEIVKLLLKHGCTVTSSKTERSNLPLYHAVESENLEMIEVLLAAGASVTEKDSECRKTPLEKAFDLALSDNNFCIVDLMLSSYNVENINIQNEDEVILFYIACIRNQINLVERIIEKGINVDVYLQHDMDQWTGCTALHYAVKYQSLEVVELLLKNKADVFSQDLDMQSSLHLAFSCLTNECDNEYARDKAEEIIDLILSALGDDIFNFTDTEYNMSHFHIACLRNNLSVIENYLSNKVDVNAAVNCKNNIFYTWFQNTPLHFAVNSCKKDVIKLLLEHGANVNTINGRGLTPLWLLLENQPKYSKIRTYLRFCKSKKKLQNSDEVKSENPLIELIVDEFEFFECIKLLVEAGSNLNYNDEYGKPLLFQMYDSTVNNFHDGQDILGEHSTDDISNICFEYFLTTLEKTFDIFKRHGIHLEGCDRHGNSILHHIARSIKPNQNPCLALKAAEIMLTTGIDPNVQNAKGEIPINIACAVGSLEFVSLLLKFNVDTNYTDRMLHTSLDAAFSNIWDDDILRSKMIALLAESGANINKTNTNGETLLFKAAKSDSYLSSMKSILEAKCCIDAQNKEGETALFVAVLQNNIQCTKMLLDHGANINVENYKQMSLIEKLFLHNRYSDYFSQTYLPVLEILEMHIRKLKLINCFVSDSNFINCKRLKFAYTYQPHINLVKDLFEDEKDQELDITDKDRQLSAELITELSQMKDVILDGDISLFDVFKNPEKILTFLRSKYLKQFVSDQIFYSKFPHFGNWLTVKYT